jgi:AhpD family alkylhydroperoxidase
MSALPPARIEPGTRREIGIVNFGITRLLGLATGGEPPNVFTTLARHRRLFRRWLWFAGALMPGGLLAREESELVILRVAHNTGCDYEWGHHERLGRLAGLSEADVQRVRAGGAAEGWSQRQSLLLAAADELHNERTISGALWSQLAELLSERELIELCLLVGHYEMLAMTLNAVQVAPDRPAAGATPRALCVMQSLIERRRGAPGKAS